MTNDCFVIYQFDEGDTRVILETDGASLFLLSRQNGLRRLVGTYNYDAEKHVAIHDLKALVNAQVLIHISKKFELADRMFDNRRSYYV